MGWIHVGFCTPHPPVFGGGWGGGCDGALIWCLLSDGKNTSFAIVFQ